MHNFARRGQAERSSTDRLQTFRRGFFSCTPPQSQSSRRAGRKRYDLTGGESLSSDEIAGLFSKLLGRKISHITISAAAASDEMAKAGTPAWLVHLLTELNAVGKAGWLAPVKPDVEKILQRKPITFEKFLRDHHAVFGA